MISVLAGMTVIEACVVLRQRHKSYTVVLNICKIFTKSQNEIIVLLDETVEQCIEAIIKTAQTKIGDAKNCRATC